MGLFVFPAKEGVSESWFWRRRVIYWVTQLFRVDLAVFGGSRKDWIGRQPHERRVANATTVVRGCRHAIAGTAIAAAAMRGRSV